MSASLSPGFADPVADSQTCFRAVLDALSHPGRVRRVPVLEAPHPLSPAAAAVLLTLVDHETPLWLDPRAEAAAPWITFHTGAPMTAADAAGFALALSLPDLTSVPAGSDEMPEASATVILEVQSLSSGPGFRLAGPGLREPATFHVDGLPADFAARWAANHALFPRGIDLILCAGDMVAALPRSITVGDA
ncbi:phosphonate C-P lyase system protein PhnH [Rhodopila sp.]|jgi:alpha-D-ribose 1-methylphosphonate 5-triphosphate synthase subunit PhnH|uniref:phosphonate C-P lyase system protein PhnH n=1 Tax=Rhodopila sp. TaxID=2480087 RepID=UPI002C8C6854|nr:phosphonate C-P lyase system protein PhnH [Rhodopila sp.]HVZ06343.1 phosphonate C-P lyase system protein PhnH [Rhodopila sp.]